MSLPGQHLAINILSTDQLDVVGVFATKAEDKFAGLDWEPGPFGSPLINRSAARMEVEIRERLQASTHRVRAALVPRSATAIPWSTAPVSSSTAAHSRRWDDRRERR